MRFQASFFAVLFSIAASGVAWGQPPVGPSPGELPPPPGYASSNAGYPSTPNPAAYPSTGTGGPTLALPQFTPPVGPPSVSPPPVGAAPSVVAEPVPEVRLLEISEPDEVIEPVVHWYQPRYWLQPTGWTTSLELGLNGSSGTSDSLSIRAGGYTKLKNDRRKVDLKLYHNRTTASGVETQNNAKFDARHDWLLPNSPWSVYMLSQVFYDEFQAFDLNVNVNSGIGYQVIDADIVKLGTTFGSGASREFGGIDDEWVPEAQFGWEYEHKLVENQKFYAKQDYFPQWEDFGAYRLLTDVGWEVELSQPSNMSLKISATDRFDSRPEGVNPHNLNYSVLLLWKL